MKTKRFYVRLALVVPLVGAVVWFGARRPAGEAPPAVAAGSSPRVTNGLGAAPSAGGAAATGLALRARWLQAVRESQASLAPANAATEPHFAAFHEWLRRYEESTAAGRTGLEKEGEALARQRRAALFSLIQTQPERALELALPRTVARDLPPAIQSLLEERISARGDYKVIAAVPALGREIEVPPIERTATLADGRSFRAFPIAARRDFPTRANLPLGGIAVDDALALGHPVQVISVAEARDAGVPPANDAICSVSGANATVANDATPVEVGGGIQWLCNSEHAEQLNQRHLAAAGSSGGPSAKGGTAESPYTEGQKRLLFFRVAFANVATPSLTLERGRQLITNMSVFWPAMSYGKTTVALPGQGSDVVMVTLPQASTVYDNQPDQLRTDVRAAATTAGVNLSLYDFD
ncbi:MAG TPA: hypothetical protein VM029_23185, partial [Opitutaceae bacterium]|nr:hypothetical protein [Opitutaceae bacterium]